MSSKRKFGRSALWDDIIKSHFGDLSDLDLTDFRNNSKHSSLNARIAAWTIGANGHRFYRSLLFNEAKRLNSDHFCILDRIQMRDLGNPVTVRVKGREICIDYLQAALEVCFMKGALADTHSVLEIGAGFGRTCHAILENFPHIRTYCVVDLPQCLEISKKYLRTVLEEGQFAKIRFISNEQVEKEWDEEYGLAINIDSMSEMDSQTVDNYLDVISKKCRHFFVKNPLGKYSPEAIGLEPRPSESARLAMKMGKITEIIDIFDEAAITDSIPRFLLAYKPGDGWQLMDHSSAPPWSYYYQAIFCKGD